MARQRLSCAFLTVSRPEQYKTQGEEDSQTSYRNIDCTAIQLYQGNHRRAQKGSAFGKYIIDAEIFPGAVRRDDLGVVGAGQRLDRTLKASHAESKDGKMDQGLQSQCVQT